MLTVDLRHDVLYFETEGCSLGDWRLAIDADGRKVTGVLDSMQTQGSVLHFRLTFPGTAVALDAEAECDSGRGTLVLRAALESQAREAVRLGRVWLLDVPQVRGFSDPGDDVVGLALDGSITPRRVFRLADPKPAAVWTNPDYPQRSRIKTQFWNRTSRRALQVGFLTFNRANTEVEYAWDNASGLTHISAWCDFAGWQLQPGQRTPLEWLRIAAGPDPYRQLESWADEAGRLSGARHWEDPPIGWVGWSWVDGFTVERYQDVVFRNAAAIRRRLAGFGVNYIWVSIGNLQSGLPGNWRHWNYSLFPDGPELFAARLAELGFKWGLWCGLFWVASSSHELAALDALLLRNPDGTPLVVQPVWSYGDAGLLPKEQRPCMYALDPSHPRTHEFLREIFATYRQWGVRYYMADFLEGGAGNISRHPYRGHHDPRTVAGPEAYHQALRAVRQGAGDDTYFLSSSGPTLHNAGFVDAARTGNDFGEGRALYPDSYFYPATYVINSSGFWTGPQDALQNQASAYYTHRRLYLNDSGNVLTVDKPLPLSQAQIHATIHALSGGPTMLGDDVARLDEERLNLIKRTLPRPRDLAFPVDLFDRAAPETPRLFHRRVDRPWGRFDVLAVYNFSNELLRESVALSRLGLDRDADYLVWEFWNSEYLGRQRGALLASVPPGSVRVYRLVRDERRPVLLGTDMHLLMGEVEISRCDWDESTRTFSGQAFRPAGERGNVFLHVPAGMHLTTPRGYWIAKDGRDQSLVLRQALDFTGGAAAWSVTVASIPEPNKST